MSGEVSIERDELISMLSKALGRDASASHIAEAMRFTGYAGDQLSVAQASAVLEHLAEQSGIVAAVARFAKARLLLRAPAAR